MAYRRMSSGQRIEWVAAPYQEQGPDGEPRTVQPGDRGRVVTDDWSRDLVVSFPAVLTSCCEPADIRPVDSEGN